MSGRRIAFVTTQLARGGAETQIARVSARLVARGHRVDVLSLLPPRGYVEELRSAGVGVHALPDRGRLAAGLGHGMTRWLMRVRPDVLVSFLFHANLVSRLYGRAWGVPAILSSIRSETFGDWKREWLERGLQRVALEHRVVTNSQLVADAMVRDGIVLAGRMEVVPNGIDMADYDHPERRGPTREGLGIADDEFLWLGVSNLRPIKDVPGMIRAFALARGAHPRARLCIAGAGEPDAAIEAALHESALEPGAVRLLGERRDVPGLLDAADALVLSSRHEGLPNVVLEALTGARPVVSTDVGGVRELVQDGRSGFVVPARDPVALGGAMRRLMDLRPEARRAMGQAGQDRVRERFDLERVTDRWEALFEAALADSRRRRGLDVFLRR